MKNKEKKEQINIEICHLRNNFEALNIDHQKGVLKTAQGLLRIQNAHKMMVANKNQCVSLEGKNEI